MEKEHKENIKYIFKKLFKESKLLRLILVNMVFSFLGLSLLFGFFKILDQLGDPALLFWLFMEH